MHHTLQQHWPRKTWWLCWCVVMGFSQMFAQGQSVEAALKSGQTLKLEWIRQELDDRKDDPSQNFPLFPDELLPGESETRVGLLLRAAEKGGGLVAEITYVNYLAFPEPEGEDFNAKVEEMLVEPIILDTRFQDQYFNPRLFLLDKLVTQTIPLSCKPAAYQDFFDRFERIVEQSSATSNLLEEQIERLRSTSLPTSFSAATLASFFCELLKSVVPEQESPVRLLADKQGDIYAVDYVQFDHPPKTCVITGNIQSPATEDVRIQFFREGDWLSYWRDSLIILDAEGNFELSFTLDHPRTISLLHGYQSMRFYLEPGDTLSLQTNANAFYRDMRLMGAARAENEFLLDFYHQMRGDTLYRRYDANLTERDHVAFFREAKAETAEELAFLFRRSAGLRPGFTALMDRSLRLEHATKQWEAAYRFMAEKRISLSPELLHHLQKLAGLLYRLPEEKSFDFDVEEFLNFQFQLLRIAYQQPRFRSSKENALAQLLPSRETFVRHSVMQLFRNYDYLGELTESQRWQLSSLASMTRDTQLLQEMMVFQEGGRSLPAAVGYRILQPGEAAPSWRYGGMEGAEVSLADFTGRKLLLHIGWADNLDEAMQDVQSLRATRDQLPEVVHLLSAPNRAQFTRYVADKPGLFVYVPPEEMDSLKERYFVDNRSNHYFLIGEDGTVLANHLDLGTATKLQGTWQKVADTPTTTGWTPEQRLRFWQSLGIGALIMLLISGGLLWRRRINTQRDLRRRQLLETELRGIRSQMNPHFLFNVMNAIQNLIRKKEREKADIYLGQFAGLMRKTLRNTAEEYIPLIDEIDTLEQYCSLESLRQPFEYTFEIEERIDPHNTYIPSMILQPIIENAILHGLGPQPDPRKLLVEIRQGPNGLRAIVTDNGIGLMAAQARKGRENHQSMGTRLVKQRLQLLGLNERDHFSIVDRSTLAPPARGTRVSLTIPVEA